MLIGNISAQADGISKQMRLDDTGLSKPVRLFAPRMYVGEVMERLSAQTGVDVKANLMDGASDPKICVFLDGVSLGDALDSIYSVLSYRGAEWIWECSGVSGSYTYLLRQPAKARSFAERMHKLVVGDFCKETEDLIRFARMSPAERLRNRQAILDTMFQQDDSEADFILNKSDRMWSGLQLFNESIPRENQASILQGQTSAKLPVSALSEQGQAFVKGQWQYQAANAKRERSDGTWEPVPMPSYIKIAGTGLMDGRAIPGLTIQLEGYAYSGAEPLARHEFKKMSSLWNLPDDDKASDSRDKVVGTPADSAPVAAPLAPLVRTLRDVHLGTPVGLVARLPFRPMDAIGSPIGKTLSSFLEGLARNPRYMSKWRDHVLLVSDPWWMLRDGADAPYALLKRVRESRAQNGGCAAVEVLLTIAMGLTTDQASDFAREAPFPGFEILQQTVAIFPATKLTVNQLRSERGAALNPEQLEQVSKIGVIGNYLAHVPQNDRISGLRVAEPPPSAENALRYLTIGLVTTNGKFMPVVDFANPKVLPGH